LRRFATYSLLLAVSGLLVLSCRKQKYPESVIENEAVFFVKGQVNGQPVALGAGIDNYYMHTSFSTDSSSVRRFTGELKKRTCCSSGLEFTLHDFSPGVQVFRLDSSFKTGMRPYYNDNSTRYTVNFYSLFNKELSSVVWDFGDGTGSFAKDPVHTYTGNTIYNVKVSFTSKQGCYSYMEGEKNIAPGALLTNIIVAGAGGKTVSFTHQTSKPVGDFLWNFGDGSPTTTEQNPSHTYKIRGSFPVTLRVKDAEGNTAYARYNVVTGDDSSSCAVNMRVVTGAVAANPGLSEVKLTWTDENGRKFFSSKTSQTGTSYFEILKAEPWGTNEKGEPIVKVTARFNCQLSDGVNIIPASGEISFAAAHY
jgi:PKD repeat protein